MPPLEQRGLLPTIEEVVGDVTVVEHGGVRVVAQRGGGVAVAEPGLGLRSLPSSTRWVATPWRRPWRAGLATPAAHPRRRNLWVSESAVRYESRAGLGAKSQSPSGRGPRRSQVEK